MTDEGKEERKKVGSQSRMSSRQLARPASRVSWVGGTQYLFETWGCSVLVGC